MIMLFSFFDQLQTNASIGITVYKEAAQNVLLQRFIRLVILCHP